MPLSQKITQIIQGMSIDDLEHIQDTVIRTKKQQSTDNIHCQLAYNILTLHNMGFYALLSKGCIIKIISVPPNESRARGYTMILIGGQYAYNVYPNKVVFSVIATGTRLTTFSDDIRYHTSNTDVQHRVNAGVYKYVSKEKPWYTKCVIEHIEDYFIVRSAQREAVTTRNLNRSTLLCYALDNLIVRSVTSINDFDDTIHDTLTVLRKKKYTEDSLWALLYILNLPENPGWITLEVINKKEIKVHYDSKFIHYKHEYQPIVSNIASGTVDWFRVTDLFRRIHIRRVFDYYRMPVIMS